MLVLAGGIVGGLAVVPAGVARDAVRGRLAPAALGSLALPEVVAVKGDVGRMNTVFKFYLQAWILLAMLAGPSAVLVWRALFRMSAQGPRVAPPPTLGDRHGPTPIRRRGEWEACRGQRRTSW